MSEETLKLILPVIVTIITGVFTIVGGYYTARHKFKIDNLAAKTSAEDGLRDDLLAQITELRTLEKSYREEMRNLEKSYREQINQLEKKYDDMIQTVRDLQRAKVELELENKLLSARVKELENELTRLEKKDKL